MEETIDIRGYKMTKKRVMTRRGVLWLGQTCNIKCHFCYFLDRINDREHPEHPFMDITKSKEICSRLVDHYGNNAIDIQGGEPTLYKSIYDLVAHCRMIGLMPTLITNALALSNKKITQRLKDSGIRDLLISVQGLGDTYDDIVQTKGSFLKQEKGIEAVVEAGIPIRFNCVLSKPVLPQLKAIAELAVKTHTRVVNFLAFNPFEDQQLMGKRNSKNVPRYSEVMPYLDEAMDLLEENHIEVNVRYFPICMVKKEHRKSMYNFQQLSYDIHEWDYASWSWTGMQPQRMKWGETSPLIDLADETFQPIQYKGLFKPVANQVRSLVHKYPQFRQTAKKIHKSISAIVHGNILGSAEDKEQLYRINGKMRASQHCRYVYGKACQSCAAKNICDGFHGDYAEIFGTDEARTIADENLIKHPKHYINNQYKVVASEDYNWAI